MHEKEYLLPFGPYHPLLKEPEYFKVYVRGEDVVNIDFELGFNYRGVEELATKCDWTKAVHLIGRVCGICSEAHTVNFCQGVETLAGIEVPEGAKYIRTILCEMNRIHSHLLYLGFAAHTIGFDTLFHWCWATREIVLEQLEMITGNRIQYSMDIFGGVRRSIDKDTGQRITRAMMEVEERLREIYEIFRTDKLIEKRMAGVGVLSKRTARELGVVGPTARGSGLGIDVRKQNPYAAYDNMVFKIITERGGDCLARTLVRAGECLESAWMVSYALDLMFSRKISLVPYVKLETIKVHTGETVALIEAPRGENVHYIVSDGSRTPKKIRIRVPTYANMISLKEMVKGSQIADVPIIIESIDPCFGCCDRMTVIDIESKREKVVKSNELLKR